MLEIKNIEKIKGYVYNAAFTINNVEIHSDYYIFSFYNNWVNEMHEFPINVSRILNADGLYKMTYKNKVIMVDKVCFTSIEKLIEVFKKFRKC